MHTIPELTVLQRGRSRGLSLVELLVAAAIGIIASLAIFQVFAVFEGQKRTTTSGGEAQTTGTLALFTLERELRQAGYGINNPDFLGCQVQGRDSLTAAAFNLELIPVKITQGALGAPDTIAVMYAGGELLANPADIMQNMATEASDIRVSNPYGYLPGDILVVAEAGNPGCATPPLCCTLAQVSTLGGAGQTDFIFHNTGTYVDPVTGQPKNIRYNPSASPPGSGNSHTTNAKLFNIGGLPANNIYSIPVGSSQLTMQQLLFGPSPPAAIPLYDGIVQLQAQYGKDTDSNGVVDVFDDIQPVNAAQWAQVLAIRVAVVARSGLYEKNEVSPLTIQLWETTAAVPTTTGPVWTLTPDERHYRYKVFQTVVPIRNMIWRP